MRSLPTHVIFDLDGTLADSSPGILGSFRTTLESIGMKCSEESLSALIGPPLIESFRILGVAPERLDEVVEIYRNCYAERGVHEATLYPGILRVLEGMSDCGVRLSVATAKRVDFACQMLRNLGVESFFDEIAGASLDLQVTSKFDIMARVLDAWKLGGLETVWMVGDRHYDMTAARDHGVVAVGALWGFGSVEELRDAGALWVAWTPADLLNDELDAASRVCLLEEVCDVCGRIIDRLHDATACATAPEHGELK